MSLFIIILLSIFGIAILIFVSMLLFFIYRKRLKKNLYTHINYFTHNYLLCYFICSNNRIVNEPLLINSDNQVSYDGGTYNVDQECLLFDKNTPIIFYYKGIPDPISYIKDKKQIQVQVDSSTYTTVMKTKLIRDLLAESKQLLIIMIMCGVIALGIIIIIAGQFGLFDNLIKQAPTS